MYVVIPIDRGQAQEVGSLLLIEAARERSVTVSFSFFSHSFGQQ